MSRAKNVFVVNTQEGISPATALTRSGISSTLSDDNELGEERMNE